MSLRGSEAAWIARQVRNRHTRFETNIKDVHTRSRENKVDRHSKSAKVG